VKSPIIREQTGLSLNLFDLMLSRGPTVRRGVLRSLAWLSRGKTREVARYGRRRLLALLLPVFKGVCKRNNDIQGKEKSL
jgi:hypothetical protein